jgi:hypothetical protein
MYLPLKGGLSCARVNRGLGDCAGGGKDAYYLLPGDESYEGSNSLSGEITPEQLAAMTRLDFAGDGKSWRRTAAPDSAPGYMGSGADSE